MCGIVGVFELSGATAVAPELIASMCEAIARRGPDDQGQFVDGAIGLGMRRLSIIDVDGGHQPIANEDGTLHIVFNGEIFNHEPPPGRPEATGPPLQDPQRHRDDPPSVRRGGRRRACGTCAGCSRSRSGTRAIVGCSWRATGWASSRCTTSSTAGGSSSAPRSRALLCDPSVPRAIDWTAIDAYFTYGYVPAPWTVYRAVRKLPAAHYLWSPSDAASARSATGTWPSSRS